MQNSFESKIMLKEFCQKALSKFSILNRFTQTPTPFLPKLTKHDESFCQCSLTSTHKFTNELFQKKSKQRVYRHGIYRGIEKTMWKFQGLMKKEVEFPGVIVGLHFWPWNFQGL